MTPPDDGGLLNEAAKHWKWLAAIPGSGLFVYLLKLGVDRLRGDQGAVAEALDQLGLTADAVGGMICRDYSAGSDCERCRRAYTHRRRVGEIILEVCPREKFLPFRPLLTTIDRTLRDLEDALHALPLDPLAAQAARDRAMGSIEVLRREFFKATAKRPSVQLLGRRSGGKRD